MPRSCNHCRKFQVSCIPVEGGCKFCLTKGFHCQMTITSDSDQTVPSSPSLALAFPGTLGECKVDDDSKLSFALLEISLSLGGRGIKGDEYNLAMNFFRLVVEPDVGICSHPAFDVDVFAMICQKASPQQFRLLLNCMYTALGFRIAMANNLFPCGETLMFYSAMVEMMPFVNFDGVILPLFKNILHLIDIWSRPYLGQLASC
ncbi:hypothetical protein DSO57_1025343 [Entomophthora muscae]|uniref:Uncharacterized protein n=1 Tax=Entomophthora muscae TaxID=34485 RepID=A0ACC2T2E0_9FUNG|nr:hypothetical protein DSO57_1025343 [Entomophthora muscae]